MSEDQQRAFGREHIYLDISELCHEMPPDAGCIDDQFAMNIRFLTRMIIAQMHTFHHSVLYDEAYDLLISHHFRTMTLGIQDVGSGQTEGIDRGVRHTNCAFQRRIHGRLQPARFLRREHIRADSCLLTSFYKLLLVRQVILRQGDKETVSLFHAVPRNATEYLILLYAFLGRLLIGDSITGTTMQKSMVAACGSIGEIAFLHQQHL